tara:strand:+ start:50915 stop:51418 length:504 start_codon:yes stop_codon:yes gene_type:complete
LKNLIKKIIKKNYKHCLFSNTEFEKYKKIKIKYKKEKLADNLVERKKISLFDVESFLLKKRVGNVNGSDRKKIFILYKKFSVNNKLKILYNKKYKKKTEKEINKKIYIYLGIQIILMKEINNLQKLNAILKILDILYIQKDLFLNEFEISNLKVLENFKKKTIQKYI